MNKPLNLKAGFYFLFILLNLVIFYSCTKSNAAYIDYDKKNSPKNALILDSLQKIESLRIADSTRVADSIRQIDSLKKIDSLAQAKQAETQRIADSLQKAQAEAQRIADSAQAANRPVENTEPKAADPAPEYTDPLPIVSRPVVTNERVFEVGYGFGELTIDGNNFVSNGNKIIFQNGDVIKIKGGSYNGITVKNISVPDGKRVLVINDGLVTLNGDFKALGVSDLNNVTISGNGTSGIDRGFAFLNNKYRAVVLSGSVNDFTLENMLFKNIGDYVINYSGSDKKIYNGSPDSYSRNLAFINLDGENISNFIQLPGDITANNHTGLFKGVEIAGLTCINSPGVGTVVFLGNVENYNIHDNFINNINSENNNHNGIFMARGNGKFYNNVIKNHQGNAIRAWQYSIEGTQTVEIYNNTVYNSRKYSAFEIQVPPYMQAYSTFKPANTKVYNNTIGKMNTERSSFPGRLLDVYNTFGTLEVYNNLVFDDNDDIILNNMSDTKIINNSNNIYKANASDAVNDVVNFVSKINNIGKY